MLFSNTFRSRQILIKKSATSSSRERNGPRKEERCLTAASCRVLSSFRYYCCCVETRQKGRGTEEGPLWFFCWPPYSDRTNPHSQGSVAVLVCVCLHSHSPSVRQQSAEGSEERRFVEQAPPINHSFPLRRLSLTPTSLSRAPSCSCSCGSFATTLSPADPLPLPFPTSRLLHCHPRRDNCPPPRLLPSPPPKL